MARDLFHQNVREALLKEGWNITDDPLRVPIDGSHLEIDLAAEMVFGAERGNEKNSCGSQKLFKQIIYE